MPALAAVTLPAASGAPFRLPTANQYLFVPGAGENFYVGTAGKPWPSGGFGCTRTDGRQFHEGLDIRCLERDRKNNPIDPILASADGTVAYINTHSGLSNYGKYIVLQHKIEGLEVHSLYAHLSAIRPGLNVGDSVKSGEQIAIMGTTSNTRQRITRDRAHLHFEIVLLLNPRYVAWHKNTYRVKKVEHGKWNGRNLLGMDPARIFLAQDQQGEHFRLLEAIRHETELCRVLVRDPALQWARRFPALVLPNPRAEQEGVAGYELSLNFNGIPFRLVPRAESEFPSKSEFQLVAVNQAECDSNACQDLVEKRGGQWRLSSSGTRHLSLLTY